MHVSPSNAVTPDIPKRAAPIAPASSDRLRIALFGDARPWPAALAPLLVETSWSTSHMGRAADLISGGSLGQTCDVAVVLDRNDEGVGDLVGALYEQRIGVVFLSAKPELSGEFPAGVVVLPLTASHDLLRGALSALGRTRPVFECIDRELGELHQLGEQLRQYFDELQHDLTLAAKLQRDFLPREMPAAGPLRFTTFYRPCNWVSGDTYDVFRIDDARIGFYLIDAVGHGMAAALLTMFIRNTIRPLVAQANSLCRTGPDEQPSSRRLVTAGAEPLPPGDVLANLNEQLVAESLPECQFVTAWYGVIDTRTLQLTYARGGHPPAIRVAGEGRMEELDAEGGLLGIFSGQRYATRTLQLSPGDRLLLFSDGLEPAIKPPHSTDEGLVLDPAVAAFCRSPSQEFVQRISRRLDELPGGLGHEADDVSLVVVDIDPTAPAAADSI